jgi:hypothetical protein
MKLRTACLLLVAVFVSLPCPAVMICSEKLEIDFANEQDARAKAEWSYEEKPTITEAGLGYDEEPEPASLHGGWIQTRPFVVGLSWRTPAIVILEVEITPAPKPSTPDKEQTNLPWVGLVYARYSPDFKHWSSWQALVRDEKKNDIIAFTGMLAVPHREREAYAELLLEYGRLDVPWVSDEEAAVTWILQRTPDFFEHSLPFIGYVEFLYEEPFYHCQRIKRFQADLSYNMSGIHMPPKDGSLHGGRGQTRWRFKAR